MLRITLHTFFSAILLVGLTVREGSAMTHVRHAIPCHMILSSSIPENPHGTMSGTSIEDLDRVVYQNADILGADKRAALSAVIAHVRSQTQLNGLQKTLLLSDLFRRMDARFGWYSRSFYVNPGYFVFFGGGPMLLVLRVRDGVTLLGARPAAAADDESLAQEIPALVENGSLKEQ